MLLHAYCAADTKILGKTTDGADFGHECYFCPPVLSKDEKHVRDSSVLWGSLFRNVEPEFDWSAVFFG